MKQGPGGAAGGDGHGGGSGNGPTDGPPPPVDGIVINTTKCGNGALDPGEQCDDSNRTGGDGCTPLCQLEDGWACPTAGQPCGRTAACGNGILEGTEACDDQNMKDGDGCSSSCTLEKGYICRVPGRSCVPLCGDGMVTANEQCDDGNAMDNDGCSSQCLLEPGSSCTPPAGGKPSQCTHATCGNGVREGNESCDCGTDAAKVPAGCLGPNGLFNGDGTGCSTTCTTEPKCRDAAGKTQACETKCGNGNIEAGEGCDDGNNNDGDGCSKDCKLEAGFTCQTVAKSDAQDCKQDVNKGELCLELPIKYRDFKSEHEPGGHPDFFYYGSPIANPITVSSTTHGAISFKNRVCVPNSSGPARQNDSTARCWGLAQPTLDATGRPAFNAARTGGTTCDCQFTDWSHNGGTNNMVPGYGNAATTAGRPLSTLAYVGAPGNMVGAPWYQGQAPVVSSATTFGQWWADGTWESDGATAGKHATQILELGPVPGGANLYRFSSAPHSVWGGFFPLDPAASNFPIYTTTGSSMGPGTARTSAAPWSEPLLCNLWPYWYSSTTFGGGNGCKADQFVFAPAYGPTIASDPAAWFGTNIKGGTIAAAQGWFHDSWFSVEARYLFAFNSAFDLQFFGDDDTFVFINGVLMVDLGGVHQRLPGKVHVDATGAATVQEGGNIYLACTDPTGQTNCPTIPAMYKVGDIVPCDGSANAIDPVTKVKFNSTCTGADKTTCDCRVRTFTAAQTGLVPGNTFEIAVFSRDGHPTESNFQLTLSGFSTNISTCGGICGDGVRTGAEECDCGGTTASTAASCGGMTNDDTAYGGCTTKCKYGPYCGDGTVQAPQEECDLGTAKNTANYGADGCTPGCKKPRYCGDGHVDASEGEQCDLGANNGMPDQKCNAKCQIIFS